MSRRDLKRLASVFVYDRTTGLFYWRVKRKGYGGGVQPGDEAGRIMKIGYHGIYFSGTAYYAHRVAWLFEYGKWPVFDIDHINGNPADNRIVNLRDVPHAHNLQNRKAPRADNTSGLLGVRGKGNCWIAEISVNGKNLRVGKFKSAAEAHQAYVAAKQQLHPGYIP